MLQGHLELKYHQSKGMHLCVPNALSSVLYVLGFDEEAAEIHGYGVVANMQNHPVVDALIQIHEKLGWFFQTGFRFRSISVPSKRAQWASKTLSKEQFYSLSWLLLMITKRMPIHDGFIYDANKAVALPYNQQALDYCTSTATKESKFVYFCRGLATVLVHWSEAGL